MATTKKPAVKKATTKKATPAKKATTVKKAAASKAGTVKKTVAKKTASSATLKLTATEKKLVELYRDASAATKKEAMEVLKADKKPNDSLIEAILANKDLAQTLNTLFKKK